MPFFLILVFGFLYRCRGGFLPTGHTQVARLIYWALPVGAWAAFHSPMLIAPVCALAAFLGLLIPHSPFMADASAKSVIGMALIGMARLALILAPLAYYHPWIMAYAPIAGLSGLGYYIGWKWLNGVSLGKFATTGSEWGEILTGAAFGLAFALIGV